MDRTDVTSDAVLLCSVSNQMRQAAHQEAQGRATASRSPSPREGPGSDVLVTPASLDATNGRYSRLDHQQVRSLLICRISTFDTTCLGAAIQTPGKPLAASKPRKKNTHDLQWAICAVGVAICYSVHALLPMWTLFDTVAATPACLCRTECLVKPTQCFPADPDLLCFQTTQSQQEARICTVGQARLLLHSINFHA